MVQSDKMICCACGLDKVYKNNVCKDCFKLGIRFEKNLDKLLKNKPL